MKKIILTKTELKKYKDNLKRYNRYLPTLYIKKQQLQMEIERVRKDLTRVTKELDQFNKEINQWINLLGEEVGLSELIILYEVKTRVENVAGVDIPVFLGIHLDIKKYDLFIYPLWVDRAIEIISKMINLKAEIIVLKEQNSRLKEELTITSQRVNLFEKVKIPESKEAIRRISIFLEDQQAAAIGWARIAKKKLQGTG